MADINVTEEIIDINVTEEVVNIIAPLGGYPLPNTINSVFGRVGNIVATEGDYTLTQLGDVTLTSPANGQVLKYNGTSWVNDSDAGVTGTGTTNTLPKFTGASTIGNSNVSDSGTLITLGSNTTISSGGLQVGTNSLGLNTVRVGKNLTGGTAINAILNDGAIQSDVTLGVFNYRSGLRTAAASFTLTSFTHFFADQTSIGAGSSITTQEGFVVNSNMTGAANNFGFRGLIPSGTNRWNIYMDGTANNYMAGSLGIGSLSLTGFSLNVGKNITGATSSYGISQIGSVQSDVTNSVFGFVNTAIIAASAFTLSGYNHYFAQQGTFGAGSSVTTQTGFRVDSSLIGATNNYAFQGQIPVGANRWNLFMNGMAANFLAGDTGIGTASLGTATQLTVGGTETAVSAISRGQLINTTLVASANGDTTIGLDINPTYSNGAFAASNYGIRIVPRGASQITLGGTNQAGLIQFARGTDGSLQANIGYTSATTLSDFQISSGGAAGTIGFLTASARAAQFFPTGNFTLQNGGTFTDAGFRLDVNGTTRFIGTASTDAPPLSSELLTTSNWTSTGWTGDFTVGFTHTTGNTSVLSNTLAAVIGTYYKVQLTITGRTAGTVTIGFGGETRTVTGTRSFEPIAITTGNLTITPTTDFNGTIIVSVRTIGLASPSVTISPSAGSGQITMRATNVSNNTIIGLEAGQRLSSSGVGDDGGNNTFFGYRAGRNSTTVRYNTFIGGQAGEFTSTGTDNTAVGRLALNSNTTGLENTAIGAFAGLNSNGLQNIFIGGNAGYNNTTGFNNLFVGYNAGRFITGGVTANTIPTNSIFIGRDARAAADNQGNQIVIGNGTTGLGTNTTIIGTTATTITGLYGNIRLVSGMGTAPASATATGTTGDIVVTAGFIYVCTATNTWVRTALTTW